MIKQFKIYAAAKIWHAPVFQKLREDYNIISRWIDYDAEHPIVQQKDILWTHCLEDCLDCDFMVVFCKDFEENQRGVLVEAGHVLAHGKPVYCINDCVTFESCPTSDVAFTHYPNWHFVNDVTKGRISARMGFWKAVSHFNQQQKRLVA